jgi:hypothetical protein
MTERELKMKNVDGARQRNQIGSEVYTLMRRNKFRHLFSQVKAHIHRSV